VYGLMTLKVRPSPMSLEQPDAHESRLKFGADRRALARGDYSRGAVHCRGSACPHFVSSAIFGHALRIRDPCGRAPVPTREQGPAGGLRPSQSEEDNPPNIVFGSVSERGRDDQPRPQVPTKRTVMYRVRIRSYWLLYRWIRRTVPVDTFHSDD